MPKVPSYSVSSRTPDGAPLEVAFYPCGAREVSLPQLVSLAAELWPGRGAGSLVVRPGLNCLYFGPGESSAETPVPDAVL